VLPHDLGPCNLRWHEGGRVEAFDWSDVVIGPPGMLMHRFLAECRSEEDRQAVSAAFGDEPLWEATRRGARLHTLWRHERELEWLDEDDPLYVWLREATRSRLRQLVEAMG
jgi:hypothetical protein